MSDGTWEKLSQVAVKGAEYDSRERQPHPKCLQGTRVDLLNYLYGLLDDTKKSQIIWLHGTAGVGKSAVAFTVAERMRGLKVTEETNVEKRLAGTFFFSRKHTKRRTTGYFFATLAYQLASNFPSIKSYVKNAILENPALLDPDKSLRDQMEALFLRPLRKLQSRLRECPPMAFIIDALDECTSESLESESLSQDQSESELTELISLLAEALRDPGLPVTQIVVTSRSEAHIHEAMQNEDVHPLVCEIPVRISGRGVTATISLDGADVDEDIYLFLEHSFKKLRNRFHNFPQPTKDQLEQLARRAGRRFIVASTMMKFIDDQHNNPRHRLQLLLQLTSKLLPGTEVNKLYDCILSTCADPSRAYMHLSIVATLADPLSISQISELLGPGEGRDVEKVLVQLRSVLEIPTDSSLPVQISHSSVRDYVSHRSNCSLPEAQYIASPHSLLALSSLQLMVEEISASTALLDRLSELTRYSQAMEPHDPQSLKDSLSFIVHLEPLQVLMTLLWLRMNHSSELQFWLDTADGCAWLDTAGGYAWLETADGCAWLQTGGGKEWLQTQGGHDWLLTRGGRKWLSSPDGKDWQCNHHATFGYRWPSILRSRLFLSRKSILLSSSSSSSSSTSSSSSSPSSSTSPLPFPGPQLPPPLPQFPEPYEPSSQAYSQPHPSSGDWPETDQLWVDELEISDMGGWLFHAFDGREFLCTPRGLHWLQSRGGREWMQYQGGWDWLMTQRGQDWLQIQSGQDWLQTQGGQEWLQSCSGKRWLQTEGGQDWLQTQGGQDWLQTQDGQDWLQSCSGQCWLQTEGGQDWLQTQGGQDWLQTQGGQEWLQSLSGKHWLQTHGGRKWWLQTQGGQEWLQSLSGKHWLQTHGGRKWLRTQGGQEWLQSLSGNDWLWTHGGREWLQTQGGQKWLQTQGGQEWFQSLSGKDWLQTQGSREWLQTQGGREWLQTQGGQEWLQTQDGRKWLHTPLGQAWRLTTVWVTMEEFSGTLQANKEYIIAPELHLHPAFQVIQQFKSLPDFLMFPVFLALRHQDSTSALLQGHFPPDIEIIHAMQAFSSFAYTAQAQSRTVSGALDYACQNWAVHLSRVPNPWDTMLAHIFESFWNDNLLSWLERQWCLKDLQSCLAILSEGQKLATAHLYQGLGSSQ